MNDRDKAKYLFGNCWYWVKPDEANYIESMVDSLQIIISAPDMKRIMQERTFAIQRNEAAIAECKDILSRDIRCFADKGLYEAHRKMLKILEGRV